MTAPPIDQALAHMRAAQQLLVTEGLDGGRSRAMSVALTELDTAILWREKDLGEKVQALKVPGT